MYYDASVYFDRAKKEARGTRKERGELWRERYKKIEKNFRAREEKAGSLELSGDVKIEPEVGYFAISGERLKGTAEILATGSKVFQGLDVERLENSNRYLTNHAYKPQLLHLDLEEKYLDVESPFLSFALDSDLIAALSRYFGFVPVLYKMNYWYSRFVEKDQPLNSQMFHLDWDDLKTVRVFLYITDVTEDQGPMVILNASDSESVSDMLDEEQLNYWRITDEKMYSMIEASRFDTLTGNSGLAAMADPARCYHYGSRVQPDSDPRFLVAFWYVSPAAFWLPLKKGYKFPYQHLADSDKLNDAQKMVLGA